MPRIPAIIHYIFLVMPEKSPPPFNLVHFLAVKSAAITHQPDTIFFYFTDEPVGYWWEQAKPYVTVHHVIAPTEVGGRHFYHPAHSADLLRLQILQEYGGIYFDLDVICKKSFAPLMDYEFCLGKQGINGSLGICNAVILAKPHSFITQKWIEGFYPETSLLKGFRSKQQFDEYWCEMSVDYPALLAQKYPEHITILDHEAFYWPLYTPEHLAMLFRDDNDFPNAYCHHLWQSLAWEHYMQPLTVEEIMHTDTYFNRLARGILLT